MSDEKTDIHFSDEDINEIKLKLQDIDQKLKKLIENKHDDNNLQESIGMIQKAYKIIASICK